jgi:hypothetical protein
MIGLWKVEAHGCWLYDRRNERLSQKKTRLRCKYRLYLSQTTYPTVFFVCKSLIMFDSRNCWTILEFRFGQIHGESRTIVNGIECSHTPLKGVLR